MTLTFKANKGDSFYDRYSKYKLEKLRFQNLAKEFFLKHNLKDDVLRYSISYNLEVRFQDNCLDKYKTELLAKPNKQNMRCFKKKSKLNLDWCKEVSGNFDFNVLEFNRLWVYGCFDYKVRYNLWEYEKVVYGFIEGDNVKLPNGVTEIKNSEYYKVIEGMEEKEKELNDKREI